MERQPFIFYKTNVSEVWN